MIASKGSRMHGHPMRSCLACTQGFRSSYSQVAHPADSVHCQSSPENACQLQRQAAMMSLVTAVPRSTRLR